MTSNDRVEHACAARPTREDGAPLRAAQADVGPSMRDFVPVIRALWYLLSGVMPAIIPLFLAMAFLVWHEKLLALAGWLGLIAAALIPPDREYPRVTSAVVLMLSRGLLLAGPAAYRATQHFSEESSISGLDLLILAPVISAASYLLETCLAMLRQRRRSSPNNSLEGEGTQRTIS